MSARDSKPDPREAETAPAKVECWTDRSGQRLGHFQLEERIGRGGFGTVYRAIDLESGQPAAVKVLHMSRTRDPAAVERFLREARAAAAVGNPYVVRILARSSPQAIPPFIVMELVEGDDLSRLLRTEGPLSVHHALRIGLQLLDGLQAVHDAGVIHRDLKPANVLLTPEGEVKLLDFGVSLLRSGRGQLFRTPQNATVGTPAYMAPEQLRSSSNADERTDVYSVSAMLFEMLTGKTPRRASTLAEHIAQASQQPVPRLAPLRPDVDPALERVIVRGLATDRDGRWASAEALAHGLISTLNAGDSGDERHPVTPGPMRKDRSRR